MKPGFLLFGLILLAATSGGYAQYAVSWYKVSGGGGSSGGGGYQISGTVGQHDATAPMTGGGYSVTGGFWALYAIQTPGAPLLGIFLTSTNTAVVHWPNPSSGWAILQNTNIAQTNWVSPLETVNDNGTIKYIIVNPPSGNRFYRLYHP